MSAPGDSLEVADEAVVTTVANPALLSELLGERDELLRAVEGAFEGCEISVRGNELRMVGGEAALVGHLFDELLLLLESGQRLDVQKVERTIDMVREDLRPSEVLGQDILRGQKGKPVRPHSAGQKLSLIHISEPTRPY